MPCPHQDSTNWSIFTCPSQTVLPHPFTQPSTRLIRSSTWPDWASGSCSTSVQQGSQLVKIPGFIVGPIEPLATTVGHKSVIFNAPFLLYIRVYIYSNIYIIYIIYTVCITVFAALVSTDVWNQPNIPLNIWQGTNSPRVKVIQRSQGWTQLGRNGFLLRVQ